MKTKTKFYWGIAGIIFIALVYYLFAIATENQSNCTTKPVTEINIGGHENIQMHIHQDLTIKINDEQIMIPAYIGIENNIMRPIHTHDGSGRIHVEGPCPRDFTLGEFFDVWGEEFTNTCIMNNCEDQNHKLTLYVNGLENNEYRDLILRENQQIEIVYEEIKNE